MTVRTRAFHGDGWTYGGRRYNWDPRQLRDAADGVSVIDPDRLGGYDGTAAQLAELVDNQGSGEGRGCWVVEGVVSSILDAGADPSGTHDSAPAFRALLGSAPHMIEQIRRVDVPTIRGGAVYYLARTVDMGLGRNLNSHLTSGVEIHMDQDVIVTRRNAAPVNCDYGKRNAAARIEQAAFLMRGVRQGILGGRIQDSAIGVYMGEDARRTDLDLDDPGIDMSDVAMNDHCRIEDVALDGIGCGVYIENTKGTYYCTFRNLHFIRCQLGMRAHEYHRDGRYERSINQNTFDNVRAVKCVAGYWFAGFMGNNFGILNVEDCGLGKGARVDVPLPAGLLPDVSDWPEIDWSLGFGTVLEAQVNLGNGKRLRGSGGNRFHAMTGESTPNPLADFSGDNLILSYGIGSEARFPPHFAGKLPREFHSVGAVITAAGDCWFRDHQYKPAGLPAWTAGLGWFRYGTGEQRIDRRVIEHERVYDPTRFGTGDDDHYLGRSYRYEGAIEQGAEKTIALPDSRDKSGHDSTAYRVEGNASARSGRGNYWLSATVIYGGMTGGCIVKSEAYHIDEDGKATAVDLRMAVGYRPDEGLSVTPQSGFNDLKVKIETIR